MHPNTKKERFSLAYIRAVAAHAGFQVVEPNVDHDSIDGILMSDRGRRPQIHFQAKATSNQELLGEEHLAFPLSSKNYDDLRADIINPRVLIVVLIPVSEKQWLSASEKQLSLRRCGYWMSLRGFPAKPDQGSVTVHVPRAQRFDSEALIAMMDRVEQERML
ncbi:DUF4365 domain-containing protein [Haliangium sp.]|uniref:DUF4365 domain-containing protein n=1 Tax=Haliangium sp. TaxID=2663208 RepID=UPI003D09AEF8